VTAIISVWSMSNNVAKGSSKLPAQLTIHVSMFMCFQPTNHGNYTTIISRILNVAICTVCLSRRLSIRRQRHFLHRQWQGYAELLEPVQVTQNGCHETPLWCFCVGNMHLVHVTSATSSRRRCDDINDATTSTTRPRHRVVDDKVWLITATETETTNNWPCAAVSDQTTHTAKHLLFAYISLKCHSGMWKCYSYSHFYYKAFFNCERHNT